MTGLPDPRARQAALLTARPGHRRADPQAPGRRRRRGGRPDAQAAGLTRRPPRRRHRRGDRAGRGGTADPVPAQGLPRGNRNRRRALHARHAAAPAARPATRPEGPPRAPAPRRTSPLGSGGSAPADQTGAGECTKPDEILPRSMGGISQVHPRSIATCSSEPLRPSRLTNRWRTWVSRSVMSCSSVPDAAVPHLASTPAAPVTDCTRPRRIGPPPCLLHVCSDVAVRPGSGRYEAAAGLAGCRTARQLVALCDTRRYFRTL